MNLPNFKYPKYAYRPKPNPKVSHLPALITCYWFRYLFK